MKKHIFKIISIFIIFIIMFNIVGCKKKKDNHQHDLKYYEKIEATCETDGNIEYWKCETCNKYFSDAKGEKEISDVTIKKLGHQYIALAYSNLEHTRECKNCHAVIDKVEHIFDENGKCSICDYQDVLEYELLENDTYEVVGLTNEDVTSVVIPEYYNNKLVTSIGYEAFSGCTNLESITIPSSVTSIGESAFADCINLSEVNITSLESWCKIEFDYDNPLLYAHNLYVNGKLVEELEIPDTVDNIPYIAFVGGSFSKVVIPQNTINIGEMAFAFCTNLSSIIVDTNNPIYDSRDNCNAIIETSTNTLIAGCKDTIIPSSVTSIGEAAFAECTSLQNITIPSSVTSIGEAAFIGCSNLSEVTIEEGATSIGYYAFEGCTSLQSIAIPSSVTSIGQDAFEGCTNLSEVNITSLAAWCQISFDIPYVAIDAANPLRNEQAVLKIKGEEITNITEEMLEGVTSIGSYAFSGYTNLQNITIPSSVTSIGEAAFVGCSNLSEVTIEEGATSIGRDAFEGCTSLQSIAIPSSVTSIGEAAFVGCSNLSEVTIEEGATSIGRDAFYGCVNLSEVNIPSLASWFKISFENEYANPLYNKQAILKIDGKEITTITEDMLQGITEIPSNAFRNLTSLTSITLPITITSIGSSAFYGCSSLESITIPSSVTSIGYNAFSGCTNLKEVIFEDPNNWKLNRRIISSDDLNNSELAALYLTDEYCYYTWTKQTA